MVPVYHALIHRNEDSPGYWASCPMPNGGCNAVGDTIRETQQDMFEAVKFYLEDYPDISDFLLTFEVVND